MRTLIVRAAVATALVPAAAGAQSLSLTESEALARLSPTVRASRRFGPRRCGARGCSAAARWPNPRLVVQPRVVAGITENITTIGQLLPITGRRGLEVSAASARVDGELEPGRRRDAPRARRSAAGVCGARRGAEPRARAARAVARVRELAEVIAKREAAGDAAGFDRLRAEREVLDVDADRAAAAVARARPRRRSRHSSPIPAPGEIIAVPRHAARRPADRRRAGGTRGDEPRRAARAAARDRERRVRGARPRRRPRFPSRNRRRHQVVQRGRRRRQRVQRPRDAAAVRPRASRNAAARRRERAQAARPARPSALRCARRSPRFAPPCRTARGGRALSRRRRGQCRPRADRAGQLRRRRARHPGAARRLSNRRSPRACVRPSSTWPRARRKSSWNSSAAGRFRDAPRPPARVLTALGRCSRSPAAATSPARQWRNCRRSTSRTGPTRPSCSWSIRRSSPGSTRRFAVHLTRSATSPR